MLLLIVRDFYKIRNDCKGSEKKSLSLYYETSEFVIDKPILKSVNVIEGQIVSRRGERCP